GAVPVDGGLTLSDAEVIGRTLADSGRLVSMDLVEINPMCVDAAQAEATLQAGLRTILASLGRGRSRLHEAC
ncbi:MAG: hypothetical protein EB120_11945, partial [Proteobacteria bacterium]|nr:hypothetical protein [Pseudomonadota bacterium]